MQQLKPPTGVARFEALRDYPRSEYNDITTGVVDPDKVEVVSAKFSLEADDIAELPVGYDHAQYKMSRYLSNRVTHSIEGASHTLA
ncbi:MAG TPA: hypothetical protein VGM12_25150 [Trebonia sp.]